MPKSLSKNSELKAYRKEAFELCVFLQKHAPKTYIVGGAVRDMLHAYNSQSSADIDIATEARPEKIKQLLTAKGLKFYKVGEKFGTIAALIQGRAVEITTFRTEKKYSDSRHPDQVKFVRDPKLDAARRDFTVNAIFYDPATKTFLDYAGGQKDLKAKKIRFVGSAAKRIKEDPLRMLRAARFATILGFKIVPADFSQIKKHAALIKKVSGQRIKQELDKIIGSDQAAAGLGLLEKSKLLENFLPEIFRLKKTRQSANYHAEGNVFTHTLLVLHLLKGRDLVLKYAGLFHDLGKYSTGRKTIKNGRANISFHGHASRSQDIFKTICKRLPFSKKDQQAIAYLIAHHMDLRPLYELGEKVLRRWAVHPDFSRLVELRIADSLGAIETDAQGRVVKKNLDDFTKLLGKIKKWNKKPVDRLLSGEEVMKLLKLRPGRQVGKILAEIRELQLSGKIKSKDQAIAYLRRG